MINGEEKCDSEGNDLLMICPNFALDLVRKEKLKTQIARNIQI